MNMFSFFTSATIWRRLLFILLHNTYSNKYMKNIIKMRDVKFTKNLFVNFKTGTILDKLLCSYIGLPQGVNYMVIGDPGVGKTTIVLDLIANIQTNPKFGNLDILFVESDIDSNTHNWQIINDQLQKGWDIVAIDSFYELQGIIKEEENITLRKAESMLLTTIKRNNKACNDREINTSFLTIQQVTKSGNFVGSNRLKHMITGMMELRLENHKNIYSDRYVVFSKNRRGDVGVRLYYSLNSTGDVDYDQERYEQDQAIRKLQSNVSNQLHDFANQFDKIFNNISSTSN